MSKGPTEYKYERCAGCDYLRYTLGMCDLHAWCQHPSFNEETIIGSYPRGADRGVPVPKWCPEKTAKGEPK